MQEIKHLDVFLLAVLFACWYRLLFVRFYCISTSVSFLAVVRVVPHVYLAVDTEMCRMCFHGYLLQLVGAIRTFIFIFFLHFLSDALLNSFGKTSHDQTESLQCDFKQVSSSSLNVMEEDLLIEYQEGSFSNSTSDNQTNLLTYCRFDFYPFFCVFVFIFVIFFYTCCHKKQNMSCSHQERTPSPVTTAEQQEAEDVL